MKLIKRAIFTLVAVLKKARASFNLVVFKLRNKKPWTRGYYEYREQEIGRVIDNHAFTPGNNGTGFTDWVLLLEKQ